MSEEIAPIVGADGSFAENWTSSLPEEIRGNEAFGNVSSFSDMATGYLKSLNPEVAPYGIENLRADLGDDYKDDKGLDSFKSIPEIYKAFKETKKMVGYKGDIPKALDQGGTEEEWSAFYSKLGRPEEASGYEFTKPEDFEIPDEYLGKIAEVAMKNNMTKKQAEGFVAEMLEYEKGISTDANSKAQSAWNERIGRVEKEWGESKDEMDSAVQNLIKHYGYEADVDNIASPEAMLLLGSIAKDLDERGQAGTAFNATRQGLELQKQETEAQIVNLMRSDPDDPNIDILQGKLSDLNKRMGRW